MKRFINLSLVVCCSFAASSAFAQTITLDSVLHVIRKQNPMLASFKNQQAASVAYADGSKSWMAPEVGGGLWMVPYKRTEDARDKGQIMLSVQQKIINPAKLNANLAYAQSKGAVFLENEKIAFNELRSRARQAYYQWIILDKKSALLQKEDSIISSTIEIAKIRYRYQNVTPSSIYKAEARVAEVRNSQVANQNMISQQNIILNQLMNNRADTHFSIDTLSAPTPPDFSEETDSTYLLASRSDIRRIDKSIQSARLSQLAQQAQSKPDFNLSFSHMIARGSGMPTQFMLLAMVSVPIAPWSSNSYRSNGHAIQKEIEGMKNEKASIVNEAQANSYSLKIEIVSLEKQLTNYTTRIIPSLYKSYRSTLASYQQNTEDLTTVVEALDVLNMIQLQYLDTLQKYYVTIVSYEKELEK